MSSFPPTRTRLLVVEDEIITARDLQDTLEELGYDVPEIASSGHEAIDLAAALRPDLVLMDINLGAGRDGVEVAGELRDRFAIPVIYLTAYADQPTLARASSTAPLGYLTKPFDRRELHATIQMALVKRQLDEQLRQSESWYSTSLSSIGDGVIATDAAGLVKFVNPVAEALTGWTHTEAVGKPLDEVMPLFEQETRTPCAGLAARVLTTRTTVFLEENTLLRTRGGEFVALDDSAAPICDARDGTLLGVVVVFRDVGEKQKIAAELERARRLESLGTLAGGLAHDLNNILAIIAGNVSLVNRPGAPLEQQNRAFAKIDAAVRRAKALTSQFLTFSKGGHPIRRPLSVRSLLREETDRIFAEDSETRPAFERMLEVQPGLWPVEADDAQVRRVVENFLRNAVQSLPGEGGRITVRASNCAADDLPAALAAILLAENGEQAAPAEGYVRLEVTDNGAGISPENLVHICEPYFTTKTTGSGLGLSVCQSIARKHSGCLDFTSRVGQGTTAMIYLPVHRKPATGQGGTAVSPGAPAVVPPGKKLHVLVMDDEPLMCDLLSMMLVHLGHTAVTALTGEEALARYGEGAQQGRSFDLVIIDLVNKMGMGGQELIAALRERDPQVAAMVCSGYCDHPIMANYRSYGFSGCLTKPISVEDLRQGLSRTMETRAGA